MTAYFILHFFRLLKGTPAHVLVVHGAIRTDHKKQKSDDSEGRGMHCGRLGPENGMRNMLCIDVISTSGPRNLAFPESCAASGNFGSNDEGHMKLPRQSQMSMQVCLMAESMVVAMHDIHWSTQRQDSSYANVYASLRCRHCMVNRNFPRCEALARPIKRLRILITNTRRC